MTVRDDDGQLIALAPFYRTELHLLGLVGYKCLRIIGDCQSGGEYGDIIIRDGWDGAAMLSVMQELLKDPDIWDCIWVCNVAGWTNALERFRCVSEKLGLLRHQWAQAFAAVKLPETHEAYLSGFSKKRRGYVNRETRQLQASHAVELIRCSSQDQLPEQLSRLYELHRKHWESVGEPGSFERSPLKRRFYESFAPLALQNGWLRLYVLKVDGKIQAAQYGYVYGDTYYALQEGYDPEIFDGIGNVLRNQVFRECIEAGLKEYDFLGGYTHHKHLWRAEPRDGFNLLLGRRSLKNSLLFWRSISPTGRFLHQGRPAEDR